MLSLHSFEPVVVHRDLKVSFKSYAGLLLAPKFAHATVHLTATFEFSCAERQRARQQL